MKRIRLLQATIGLATLFVFPISARAQFFVDCSNPSAVYPTINSALAVAGPAPVIIVNGTCNENVSIFGFGTQTFTLGGAATLNGNMNFFAAPNVFVFGLNINGNLTINNSQNVSFFGVNVTNSFGDGIDVNSSRSVVLDSCTSNGNSGNGLSVGQGSDVAIIANGSFSSNGAEGIFVGSNSMVNVSSFAGITEISNNQSSAIGIDRAVFEASGSLHVAANHQVAIDSRGAGKSSFVSFSGAQVVIENNPKGAASLQENSEISIGSIPPGTASMISNNGPFGIEAGFGSQVTFFGATVTGHAGPAVDIYAHSQFYGSQLPGLGLTQIQNNATAGGSLNAAIRVDGNSEALLRGVTISQSGGPAILALVNSSVDFAGSTFTGNTGLITCDSTSPMVSDLSISARTPGAGVACTTAHALGNRAVNVPTPAVPDISVWKKLHANYQQRAAAQK